MNDLQERVAVVTGAGSGIGLAIATRLAEAGAQVVLSDLNRDRVQAEAEHLIQQGLAVQARHADASSEEHLSHLIQGTANDYGRLDILVNNAGMQHVAPAEDFPVDTFHQMIDLMLVGPFVASKYALPIMRRQRFGRILNMASVNGLVGFAGKAAYNAAKHGLIGLTKVLALETATDQITVNALCPGYVDTPLVRHQLQSLADVRGVDVSRVLDEVIFPLVPQKRLLTPEEVAHYALFLASDEAGGVTGQAVVIDGGYLAQ